MGVKKRKSQARTSAYQVKERKTRALKERTATYTPRSMVKTPLPTRVRARSVVPLGPHDWDKYRGETIAHADGQILAHGHDLDQVLQEVWERYGSKPNEVNLLRVARRRL